MFSKKASLFSAFAFLGIFSTELNVTAAHADKAPLIHNGDFTAISAPYASPEKTANSGHLAFEAARKNNKLILLDFGANWCPDCRVLAGILANPEVSKWVKAHFAVATINVDHLDNANMKKARRWGVEIHAIPTVLALTPNGTLLNKDALLALGDARKMNSQQVVDLLQTWLDRGTEAKKIEQEKNYTKENSLPDQPKYYENSEIKLGQNLNVPAS
ncbi:thioredoxin family protein [Acetobacteraceae bacterium]|nr:thioredoxin family protein [Acetobacteraceae bacterium]